jgi:hypothetical protein
MSGREASNALDTLDSGERRPGKGVKHGGVKNTLNAASSMGAGPREDARGQPRGSRKRKLPGSRRQQSAGDERTVPRQRLKHGEMKKRKDDSRRISGDAAAAGQGLRAEVDEDVVASKKQEQKDRKESEDTERGKDTKEEGAAVYEGDVDVEGGSPWRQPLRSAGPVRRVLVFLTRQRQVRGVRLRECPRRMLTKIRWMR